MLIAAAVAAAPSTAHADDDPWLGKDKALHFGVSSALAVTGFGVGRALFDRRGQALLFGGGIALGAGIAKETADEMGFGDPSWKDLAWDGIGVVVGLVVAWAVDRIVWGSEDVKGAGARSAFVVTF